MKIHQLIVTVLLMVAAACEQDQPPQGVRVEPIPRPMLGMGIEPFHPRLLKGEGDPVCAGFASAWNQVYESDQSLSEVNLDLAKAFPQAQFFSYPESGNGGLWAEAYSHKLDLKGDGKSQVLQVEGINDAYRYEGVSIDLFESENDFEAALEQYRQEANSRLANGQLELWRMNNPPAKVPVRLAEFGALQIVHFMILGNALYAVDVAVDYEGHDTSLKSSLHLLLGSDKPQESCLVELKPFEKAVETFAAHSGFFQSLEHFYGNVSGACRGTMGWTAPAFLSSLPSVLHRPRYMRANLPLAKKGRAGSDGVRELRYLSWGLSDPMSWSHYLQWKATQKDFVDQLTGYYRKHFTNSDEEARSMAMDAFRFVSDTIIYNSSEDGPLAKFAADPSFPAPIQTQIFDSPEKIVALATDSLLEAHLDKPGNNHPDTGFDALIAAIYTRQPIDKIRTLANTVDQVYLQAIGNATGNMRVSRISQRDAALSRVLLAALGDKELVELALSLGANAGAGTNNFHKTPLMYAAQMNFPESVRLLLEKGAAVNKATSIGDDCMSLERDNRTALMYAAENAEPAVIETLLAAGADKAAVDSQGNAIGWYLARNAGLSEQQKAALMQRLQSGQAVIR